MAEVSRRDEVVHSFVRVDAPSRLCTPPSPVDAPGAAGSGSDNESEAPEVNEAEVVFHGNKAVHCNIGYVVFGKNQCPLLQNHIFRREADAGPGPGSGPPRGGGPPHGGGGDAGDGPGPGPGPGPKKRPYTRRITSGEGSEPKQAKDAQGKGKAAAATQADRGIVNKPAAVGQQRCSSFVAHGQQRCSSGC